ncbi:MAG: pilus assembly protein TadG-related protein, partial [Paracoccaceae bacterium]|nr:pilus assembly protein TadG-related protein [Paracoccaceae bacterium]
MFVALWQILQSWHRFNRDEAGSGTIMGLFGAMTCLALTGIAIDTSNAWRTREQMRMTADAAAHAAAIVLAQGGSEDQIRETALRLIEANMPEREFGQLYRNKYEAVRLVDFNAGSNSVVIGVENAVQVRLERSRRLGNAIPTYLLQFAGINDWQIAAGSTTGVLESQRCSPSQGIYARGKVTLAAANDIDRGYCIHGQEAVWLPQNNSFSAGAWVSMQDLVDCKNKCNDIANPGIAATETNFILRDTADFINDMVLAFTEEGMTDQRVGLFFQGRPLASDLSALSEIGVDTTTLSQGDVVHLNQMQASRIRAFPAGLVYDVSCSGPHGQGRNLLEISEFSGGTTLRDAVLITDCAIVFGEGGGVRGGIVISTNVNARSSISAYQGAQIGTFGSDCSAEDQSVILGVRGANFPAGALLGNAALVMGGDIDIAASPAHDTSPQIG